MLSNTPGPCPGVLFVGLAMVLALACIWPDGHLPKRWIDSCLGRSFEEVAEQWQQATRAQELDSDAAEYVGSVTFSYLNDNH